MSILRRLALILFASLVASSASIAGEVQSDTVGDAERLYRQGRYDAAEPLYKSLADEKGISANDHRKRLRDWGDCLCKSGKPHEALQVFKCIESNLGPQEHCARAQNAIDQSVCAALLNDSHSADRLAAIAMQEAKAVTGVDAAEMLARATALRAYIDYVHTRWADAAREFDEAAALNEASNADPLVKQTFAMKLSFAAAGANYHLARWAKATECFRKFLRANEILFGKNDLQTGWSHLAVSDTLRKQGDKDEWKNHYAEAVRIFRRFNSDNLIAEYSAKIPPGKDRADLERLVQQRVFGSNPSADAPSDVPPLCTDHLQVVATHDPASIFVRPFDDAPGRVWANPWVEPKGIVICVHGLSLQHSSYDALARKLADAGYTTIAFDMRGFGTYQQALGADLLDFDGCMEDLSTVVASIRGGDREYPMFILGESMGGAIAMQFTALHPDLVTGLIAAVPAGKRFKQGGTALKVAVTYLIDKNKPINIGADVIKQATTDPAVKSQWTSDPLTRGQLSPEELVHFQTMMNKNVEHAKRIRRTPVIVYQGMSDKLVKPDATYDLFRAIAAKDKSLMMIGNTEHLIFEEGCFTEPVFAGLVAWMDSHLPAPASANRVPAER